MSEALAEIERQFGMTVADAAGKAGMAGMMECIPAEDIYEVVVDAALLFAATMSVSRMTETEFIVMCRLKFEHAQAKARDRKKPHAINAR